MRQLSNRIKMTKRIFIIQCVISLTCYQTYNVTAIGNKMTFQGKPTQYL